MKEITIMDFDDGAMPTIQCDTNGFIKVLVKDIENLGRMLNNNIRSLGVLIYYQDKESGEIKVWDGE
jgi:hypothetical protein